MFECTDSKSNRTVTSNAMKRSFLILILGFVVTGLASGQIALTRRDLNTGWKFREAGKPEWHPATVPGCVHTDLLDNKLIEDPFYRDSEKRQQWIGKTDWEYQTTLTVTPELLK